MKRLQIKARPNWQAEVERHGLKFHTPEGHPYWDESVCYRFNAREVDELEAATEELQRLCLLAGQFIIDHDRFDDFHIPAAARPPFGTQGKRSRRQSTAASISCITAHLQMGAPHRRSFSNITRIRRHRCSKRL